MRSTNALRGYFALSNSNYFIHQDETFNHLWNANKREVSSWWMKHQPTSATLLDWSKLLLWVTIFSNHVVGVRSQENCDPWQRQQQIQRGEADVSRGHGASHDGAVCLMFKLLEQQRANWVSRWFQFHGLITTDHLKVFLRRHRRPGVMWQIIWCCVKACKAGSSLVVERYWTLVNSRCTNLIYAL